MRQLDPETVKCIREALSNGETGISIARRMGISKSTVSRIRTGQRHDKRLTKEQRAAIRLMIHQGAQRKVAAIRYEVSETTVRRICKEAFATIPAGATDAPTT